MSLGLDSNFSDMALPPSKRLRRPNEYIFARLPSRSSQDAASDLWYCFDSNSGGHVLCIKVCAVLNTFSFCIFTYFEEKTRRLEGRPVLDKWKTYLSSWWMQIRGFE